MTVAVSKDKELRLLEDDAGGNAQSTPKPKFLEQLETFLKKELKALKATEEGASELRLQVQNTSDENFCAFASLFDQALKLKLMKCSFSGTQGGVRVFN